MLRKTWSLIIMVSLTLSLIATGCGANKNAPDTENKAEKVSVKITTVQLPQQILGEGATKLGDAIKKEFGDNADVNVFTSGQLYKGSAEEMEALTSGDIQFAFITGPGMNTINSAIAANRLPYLYDSIDTAYRVIKSDVARKTLFKPFEDKGIIILNSVTTGSAMISNSKKLIRTPEDVKGLKIRMADKVGIAILEAMGGQAITTPSNETITALQQGMADGVSTQISVFYDRRFYDVQKYITDLGMFQLGMSYVGVNKQWWEGLSEPTRTKIQTALNGVMEELQDKMKTYEETTYKALKDKGFNVTRLNDAELQPWKDATEKVYDTFGAEIGADIIKSLQEEAAKK